MNPNVLHRSPAASVPASAPRDELRVLDHVERREWAGQCSYCGEPLQAGARQCPLCLGEVASPSAPPPLEHPTSEEPRHNHAIGDAAGLSMAAAQLPLKPKTGAEYTLESPAHCPECAQEIRTIRVLRLLRTQVSFTSTLPRKGYVVVCPACERLISAALSGLI